MTARCFMLLGGMTGQAWEAYIPGINSGMLALRDRIEGLGVPVSVYPWGQWRFALADMSASGCRILIGYSGGGWCSTLLADSTATAIDLMVGYDPSPPNQMQPLGGNVKKAICYYNTSPFFFGLGGGKLTLAVGNTTTSLTTVTISEQHLAVQYDWSLHAQTLAAVRDVAGVVG